MFKRILLTLVLLFSSGYTFAYDSNALNFSSITITRSLNYDAQKANISPKVVATIVRVFSWKIDFNRDLQKG
ncbi:MAG: hypothetical protein NZ702_01490, partial [Gammaproteobacteria bacterium]|nr:hypothetical protein [Gammaproteobacteria bacterium]